MIIFFTSRNVFKKWGKRKREREVMAEAGFAPLGYLLLRVNAISRHLPLLVISGLEFYYNLQYHRAPPFPPFFFLFCYSFIFYYFCKHLEAAAYVNLTLVSARFKILKFFSRSDSGTLGLKAHLRISLCFAYCTSLVRGRYFNFFIYGRHFLNYSVDVMSKCKFVSVLVSINLVERYMCENKYRNVVRRSSAVRGPKRCVF